MNILDTIAARTRERVNEECRHIPTEQIAEAARAAAAVDAEHTFPFERALAASGMAFICEVKKASPSQGVIAEEFPYVDIARAYEEAGASAVSCLTEPYWFQGDDVHLKNIAREIAIPVLRKDFVVDARMVYQAKLLGASAVLLICAILDDEDLAAYVALADELGLSALVEAHDVDEVRRAKAVRARIIGVNNRDLKTFRVDVDTSLRLHDVVGTDVLFVSESGIKTPRHVARLAQAGVDAVLIGETLMRQVNKRSALDELRGGVS